jgi:1-acyl-sn-glycerol-3-phosphate acyltransferase
MPDTFVWTSEYHTSKKPTPLLTLSHASIFDVYPKRLVRSLARMGAIRAAPKLALNALQDGYAVQVYPGGDYDACRKFSQRNQIVFAGQQGYAKLAKLAGVPIVPIVSIGGHESLCVLWDGAPLAKALKLDKRYGLKTFPLSLCLPWGLWLGPLPGYLPLPTQITVKVLPPIEPVGDIDKIDQAVRFAMQNCLDELASSRHYLGINQGW